MFQLCNYNTDNIVYCSHGKCIDLLLHNFHTCTVLLDAQARKSSLCSASLLRHHLLAICSHTQSGSITKLFANRERNQTYDCRYARFMSSKVLDDVGFLVVNHVTKLVEYIDVFVFTNATHKELLR